MNGKKTKEILSIICSVAGAILAFLILFLGLHWNIILCMLLCAAIYAALLLILKPSERIGKIDVSSLNNGELLHDKLSEAGNDFARMKKSVKEIQNPELSRQCHELLDIADSILKYLTKNPQKIASARRYIDYYQETAANIIGHYVELQETRMSPDEMNKALLNTQEAVSTLKEAFQMQFKKLVQNELLDMDADLNLLKQTLYSEGYSENKKDKVK